MEIQKEQEQKEIARKAAFYLERACGFVPFPTAKQKKSIPYAIYFNGARVQLKNGKHTWPSLGAAKSAITDKVDYNFIKNVLGDEQYEYYKWKERYKKIIDILINEGILEFRPLKEHE